VKPARYRSRLVSARLLAPHVRELTLAAPTEPFSYAPGQWLSLHLPIGERPPLVRAYTLAAAPQPLGELILCLDRYPGGLGSVYLFDLPIGEEIAFDGPLGRFTLPETTQEQLWLARFTGIVPFRALRQQLEQNPPSTPVTLLYEAGSEAELIYREEFQRLAEQVPWFRVRFLVSDESAEARGSPEPILAALPDILRGRTDVAPMVCGTNRFLRPIREYFRSLGYERRSIQYESYD